MPFGCLAKYTNADIDTPSCAWSVIAPGLTLACALADNQNASTMVALFSHFSDILRLPFSSRFAIVLLIASQRTTFCYAGGCLNASFADFTLRNEIEA